jgi:hypothetical protein
LTLQAVAAYEPHPPWCQDFLEMRSKCYTQLKHPKAAAARRDLEQFLRHEPPALEVNEDETSAGPNAPDKSTPAHPMSR